MDEVCPFGQKLNMRSVECEVEERDVYCLDSEKYNNLTGQCEPKQQIKCFANEKLNEDTGLCMRP